MTRIVADQEGERLDVLLARSLPDFSRSFLQRLCKDGKATTGTHILTPNSKLKMGQVITIDLPAVSHPARIPKLDILYEDDDVIVVNKPAGLLTHAKGAVSQEATVADFVAARGNFPAPGNRPGIVHRLDRATSGVLIAAKTPAALGWLQKQFSQRKVKKAYLALVVGEPKNETARIDLPIERNPKKPQTFRVGANGKPAQTDYRIERRFKNYTLLRLSPLTGRTHQLRVHAAYLHCPIVGDELYGQPEPSLGRMFLHAAELEITLPSRERRVFSAPLPNDLIAYMQKLV